MRHLSRCAVLVLLVALIALLAGLAGQPGQAAEDLPHFASLRADRVNVRTGPGVRYPIVWVFVRQGLPVEITAASSFEPGIPRPLFDGNYLFPRGQNNPREYDVSPDGKRFLMVRREPGSTPTRINLVFNWLEELERLVPSQN